ncbi:MAG: 4-alpha-glucanotransferase [Inquilinus sp.]|nr:4-alpha-glucanotransferase [Inquilinus sp.]
MPDTAPDAALDRLAAAAGIAPDYHDAFGTRIEVPAAARRALLAAMGHPAGDAAQCAASLAALVERPWRRPIDPVAIVAAEAQPGAVTLTLPADAADPLPWTLALEDGTALSGEARPDGLAELDRRHIDGADLVRRALVLPAGLPEGYHRLRLNRDAQSACRIIVAPPSCWGPDDIAQGERVWGLACQLYSLRSQADWGIGTFGDLAKLAERAGAAGADLLGLNPLHALYPADPGQCSPYAPASRDFLNVLYIDAAALIDTEDCGVARDLVASAGFQARLKAAREAEFVDYPAVAALVLPVLERCFAAFRRSQLAHDTLRAADFRAFCAEQGEALRRFTQFMGLQEHFAAADPAQTDWRRWPAAYRDPAGAAVAEFAGLHAERIEFHAYLQWVADTQLAEAAESARSAGQRVGLYRDLAVGVGPASATAWGQGGLLGGVAIGAPPDLLNRLGQDWGLAPYHPEALQTAAFAPLIASLRANMRHAGALRIDHAMGLARQYWIPAGRPATAGAYVAYPLDAILRIVALESRRERCLVIGEDLGTVPEGFRERLESAGILSYRVLQFERAGDDLFARPATYPEAALVTASTHDLATLAGFWRGRDLDWRRRLSLYPDDAVRDADSAGRIADRRRLIDALVDAGLWPAEPPTDPQTLAFGPELAVAIERFLARTPSRLLVVPLEDALGMAEQMNLPGTVDEHPNWRRRLTPELDAIFAEPAVLALLAALREERGGGAGR